MRVLIDTNVILDIFLKREPFFTDSYNAMNMAINDGTECFISASAVTDIFYLLRKGLGSADLARECLNRLIKLVDFADVTAENVIMAMSSEMSDFEDALVSAVAVSYSVDYIVTRNIKDFAKSTVEAVTPTDFLAL